MKQFTMDDSRYARAPLCAGVTTMAERELAAFIGAVTQSFGPEAAASSADEWLHELAAARDLPTSTREWRSITLKASAAIAARLDLITQSVA